LTTEFPTHCTTGYNLYQYLMKFCFVVLNESNFFRITILYHYVHCLWIVPSCSIKLSEYGSFIRRNIPYFQKKSPGQFVAGNPSPNPTYPDLILHPNPNHDPNSKFLIRIGPRRTVLLSKKKSRWYKNLRIKSRIWILLYKTFLMEKQVQ
jgi:hypothetical protein